MPKLEQLQNILNAAELHADVNDWDFTLGDDADEADANGCLDLADELACEIWGEIDDDEWDRFMQLKMTLYYFLREFATPTEDDDE